MRRRRRNGHQTRGSCSSGRRLSAPTWKQLSSPITSSTARAAGLQGSAGVFWCLGKVADWPAAGPPCVDQWASRQARLSCDDLASASSCALSSSVCSSSTPRVRPCFVQTQTAPWRPLSARWSTYRLARRPGSTWFFIHYKSIRCACPDCQHHGPPICLAISSSSTPPRSAERAEPYPRVPDHPANARSFHHPSSTRSLPARRPTTCSKSQSWSLGWKRSATGLSLQPGSMGTLRYGWEFLNILKNCSHTAKDKSEPAVPLLHNCCMTRRRRKELQEKDPVAGPLHTPPIATLAEPSMFAAGRTSPIHSCSKLLPA